MQHDDPTEHPLQTRSDHKVIKQEFEADDSDLFGIEQSSNRAIEQSDHGLRGNSCVFFVGHLYRATLVHYIRQGGGVHIMCC